MDVIGSGTADVLWIWEFSRATRDRRVWPALIAACQDNNVKIALDQRVYDPNDPEDAYILDQHAAQGVRESGMTSKRTRRDVRAQAYAGRPHGRVPYGYLREYDALSGELIKQMPDPVTAPVVREAAERFLAGEALYSISTD